MTDPLPLPVPPLDYASHAPYIVAFEFHLIDEITFVEYADLSTALFMFLDPAIPIGTPGSPLRRILLDGRGVTVFGCIDQPVVEHPYVVTREVIEVIRHLHLDEALEEFTLLDWELTMMSRQP